MPEETDDLPPRHLDLRPVFVRTMIEAALAGEKRITILTPSGVYIGSPMGEPTPLRLDEIRDDWREGDTLEGQVVSLEKVTFIPYASPSSRINFEGLYLFVDTITGIVPGGIVL